MKGNARLEVRMTQRQIEMLKLKAESKGFKTVSSYVRFMLLYKPLSNHKLEKEERR